MEVLSTPELTAIANVRPPVCSHTDSSLLILAILILVYTDSCLY